MALMPLLRSFGFWRFAFYKYAAPLGLRKAPFALGPLAVATGLCRPATPGAVPRERPEATKSGLLEEAALLFRSAGRPESSGGGRPC